MTSCLTYAYIITYIHHGHIWHRNKLSRCQLELLVSCSHEKHQTSLKWDSSSHPVAPECRGSHTLRLNFLQLMFNLSVSHAALGSTYQLTGTRRVTSDVDYPPGFPKTVIHLPKSTHNIFPSWCTVLFYTCKNISYHLRRFKTKLFEVLFHRFLWLFRMLWNYLHRVRGFKPTDLHC